MTPAEDASYLPRHRHALAPGENVTEKRGMYSAVYLRVFLWLACLYCAMPAANLRAAGENAAVTTAEEGERGKIEAVLQAQADAWNRGDIDAFMEGYAHTPDLRFASGGTVTRGWQETLDRYRHRYPDRAAMGTLTFSGLETTVLSADAAVVFGHWKLRTAKGEPGGLFTLLLRCTDAAGWRVVADHTSSAGS